MNLKDQIKALPLTSGVYLMKDSDGNIIYVGKAVSLRKRVQSYFKAQGHGGSKTDWLVASIKDIDFIPTNSEAEALILEASLIKKHTPKFNVELRDDKSYPYIVVTNESYPRIFIDRPREKVKGFTYYGPYVQVQLVREALAIIRKVFRYRTCHPFPEKECLDFHIGLCEAPCIQNISQKEYHRNIRHIELILSGEKDELYRQLKEEMEARAENKDFETAAKIRDQIQAIGALYGGTKDVNYFKEAEQLQRALNLPRQPERIECFDISNIMGNQAVGSMVSFLNGKPDKKNYRRFRIKDVKGIDDFQMIAEVVHRRYKRQKEEGKAFPDLIIVDGGKGQLSSACFELRKLDIQIPIVSLAKREEEIFVPNKRDSIRLATTSLGLKLLQRIRDEAHRFAVSYHRLLRAKHMLGRNTQ